MSLYIKKRLEKKELVTNHRKVVFRVGRTSNVDVVYRLDQGPLRRMPARHLVHGPRTSAKHLLYHSANEHLDAHREEEAKMGKWLLLK